MSHHWLLLSIFLTIFLSQVSYLHSISINSGKISHMIDENNGTQRVNDALIRLIENILGESNPHKQKFVLNELREYLNRMCTVGYFGSIHAEACQRVVDVIHELDTNEENNETTTNDQRRAADHGIGKRFFYDTTYNVADMSIFYQFPQYISIGLSEVFTSVASLEFAYLAAPQSAQSLVMSLRFCSAGISSFLGSGYIKIYENIYENFTVTNLECSDSENSELFYVYFFVLAGIQVVFIFIFLACDHRFKLLHNASQNRFNTHLFIRTQSRPSRV
ncbi:unnamed protein product [Rotaria magnacalcarata]|uniref:Uncharacterized protein n=1 Tax=Rotaria magnacalcarata TaxID=392030 RepID=A0A819D5L0_9BILA|nr:unnamed protein product [Rotaria magnacalcarata]